MLSFLIRFASLFTIALWVGGGAVISFIVAPTLFERAGSRKLAGEMVGGILKRFDRYVFVAGPIAIFAILLERAATVGAARTLTLKLALVTAMLGLALYSRLVVSPELRQLRERLGDGVDVLPREDPGRRAFGRLHGLSVLCLLGEILFGAFALALEVMTLP
jgi:uncharacterized membrane protein